MVTNIHTIRINTNDAPKNIRHQIAKRAQSSADRNGFTYYIFPESPINEILTLKNLGIAYAYKHRTYIQLSLF